VDQKEGKGASMKKGMSPLFSTIILIGFAIALGGMVMSWGKAGYTFAEPECEGVSMSLVSYAGNSGVCGNPGKLYITVQNNGEISLDGAKVSLIGDDIYTTTIEEGIDVADVTRLELSHPDIGKIEKVIFTPKYNYMDKEKLCPKNGFSAEDIGEC
jgi:flagellin-like protein